MKSVSLMILQFRIIHPNNYYLFDNTLPVRHFVMNEATKKVIGNANIKYILANPVMLPIIRSIGAWHIDIYITCVPIPEIRLTAVVKKVGKITLRVILNDIAPIQKPRRGGIIM